MNGKPKPKVKVAEPTAKAVRPIRAMSPATVDKELKALKYLFDHTTMTNESYDNAKTKLFRALELWGRPATNITVKRVGNPSPTCHRSGVASSPVRRSSRLPPRHGNRLRNLN